LILAKPAIFNPIAIIITPPTAVISVMYICSAASGIKELITPAKSAINP